MKKVLLVEDDRWLSDMYGSALGRVVDVELLIADSANSALVILDEHRVDLVILDMFLGEHNGIEFLHEIASYQDTRQIPVIVLSAVHKHDFGMRPDRWLQYNVVDYLYKPDTKPGQLVAAVSKQLLKTHQRVSA